MLILQKHIFLCSLFISLSYSSLEITAAILSLWCVWLAAKNKVLNWPISMVASVLYGWVFYQNRFYSESYLQMAFFAFQSYGWWYWTIPTLKRKEKPIQKTPQRFILWIILLFFVGYFIWFNVYTHFYKDARYPIIDVFLTVLSLTALFMQARRWYESWFLWILADLIYVPMFYLGDQPITALLYLIFIFLAIFGLLEWQKAIKKASIGSLF